MKKISLILSSIALLLIIWACSDLEHSNPFDPGWGNVTALNNVSLEIKKIDQIKVIWDSDYYNTPGYTFQVDKKIGVDGVWQEKYKVFTQNFSFFTDSLAAINETNFYRVRVGYDKNLSEGIEKSVYNEFAAPANLSYIKKDINTVQLNWSDNTNGEDGFKIDRYSNGIWQNSYTVLDDDKESWTDSSAVLNDSLKYRIYGYKGVYTSQPTVTQTFANSIPAPTNLSMTSLNVNSVKLKWNDNTSGEQGFKIDKKVGGGTWTNISTVPTDTVSFTDTSADINQTIQYRVYSYVGTEYSDYAESISFNNIFPAPSNLFLSQIDLSTVRLVWTDNSAGEQGFIIDKKNSSGVWVTNVHTTLADIETWTDTSASISDSLAYRIRAYKNTSYSVYTAADIGDITFPPPSGLTTERLSLTSIKFNWTDNSTGEEGFIIDRQVNGGAWAISYATVGSNVITWTEPSVAVNQTVQYRIYGKSGSNFSNYLYSEIINNTIPAPTNLSYSKLDINSIKITWTDNSLNETGYIIDRQVNDVWTNSYATVGTNVKEYTDNSAVVNANILYRVKAYYSTAYSTTTDTGIINNLFPAPTNLFTNVIGMGITLTWQDNSNGETGFKIDRKYNGDAWVDDYAQVAANLVTWNETVADTGKYYYRVKAYSGTDLSATSAVAEAWAKQTDNQMILVPAGTFQMGQVGVAEPVHEVTLTHSYYMAKYETTQKEWADIMGSNPAHDYGVGDNYPVYYVSWYDILVYCNKRSITEGLQPCYVINNSTNPNNWGAVPISQNATWDAVECRWYENGYRLPTEAEWEHAARYNDSRTYPWGETAPDATYCNFNNNNSGVVGVGSYLNGDSELGFSDLAGNLSEFCWDWKDIYTIEDQIDPIGASVGSDRVMRGGNWQDYSQIKSYLRSGTCPQYNYYNSFGFRVAKNNPNDPRVVTFMKTYGDQMYDPLKIKKVNDNGYAIFGSTVTTYNNSNGLNDFYLIKLDETGNYEWEKNYGGTEGETGQYMNLTSDNGFILTGNTASYTTDGTNQDVWIVKTDATGNIEWSKNYGTSYSDTGYGITNLADGGYFIVGSTIIDIGRSQGYTIKVDSNGDRVWEKGQLGDQFKDNSFAASVETLDNSLLLVGKKENYEGTTTPDIWIIKLNSIGDILWEKTYGDSISHEYAKSICKMSDNTYLICGVKDSSGWVIKIDSEGNILWQNTYPQYSSSLMVHEGKVNNSNEIFLTGYSKITDQDFDYFLLKIDNSGSEIWRKNYGVTLQDIGHSLDLTSDNGIVLGGFSYSTTPTFHGDVLIIKTDENGNVMGWK